MKQTFDRHMSALFEQPSQSDAAFAGERRFSKSRRLSASVSFLPLPLPPLSVFGSCFISRAAKTEIPFLGLSFLRNQTETLAKQANMGYDQYTVPDDCSCRTYFCCFPLALANICLWPPVPIFQISLKIRALETTHNTFRDCSVHFSRQPFSK